MRKHWLIEPADGQEHVEAEVEPSGALLFSRLAGRVESGRMLVGPDLHARHT